MMQVIRTALLIFGLLRIAVAADNISDGIQAFNHGKYAEATNLLQPAARNGDPRASVYLALAQAAMSDCAAALPVLTGVTSPDRNLSRLAGLAAARCYSSSGETIKALRLAEDLKQRFPNEADVLYVAAETEMKAFNDTTFSLFQHAPSSYRVHELSARIFEVQNR
jgi:uncharacterized protein HemY